MITWNNSVINKHVHKYVPHWIFCFTMFLWAIICEIVSLVYLSCVFSPYGLINKHYVSTTSRGLNSHKSDPVYTLCRHTGIDPRSCIRTDDVRQIRFLSSRMRLIILEPRDCAILFLTERASLRSWNVPLPNNEYAVLF